MADPTLTKERLCAKGFSTKTVRNVPPEMRKAAFAGYGIDCTNRKPSCATVWELDHLISLEISGANDVKNLWPEHYSSPHGARTKDKLENKLHAQVCSNRMSLEDAQNCISSDWIACYKRVMGVPPQ